MPDFKPDLNPHYNFDCPQNMAEIKKVDSYLVEKDHDTYQIGGGDVIPSPWGTNKTLDAGILTRKYSMDCKVINPESLKAQIEKPQEFCQKELQVNPGNMLSLQRHRARQELWTVKTGLLTVILDGEIFDIPEGQSIFIPIGAVHCMNNRSDQVVKVIEMQTGITREKDNIRLVDFSHRPTYPLTTKKELESARLYAALHQKIAKKFGLSHYPHTALLTETP